ncbi:MAG: hypothetical protein ACLFOY_07120, partial [Desulfatibacillaceae bacterium]
MEGGRWRAKGKGKDKGEHLFRASRDASGGSLLKKLRNTFWMTARPDSSLLKNAICGVALHFSSV